MNLNKERYQYMQTDRLLRIAERSYEIAFRFHIGKTGIMPSRLALHDTDKKKSTQFLVYVKENFEAEIEDYILNEEHSSDDKISDSTLIHLKCGVTIYIHNTSAFLYHNPNEQEEKISQLRRKFTEIKQVKNSARNIGIITNNGTGLGVQTFEYSLPENSLIEYLPQRTQTFYQTVVEQLETKNGCGLYLMYGEPGTGKTSFIKDVLSQTEKQALFISPFFTESLTSPDLISLLMQHPDSILVIEDAETVLMERKADNSSAVSNVLNLTDGFLADFLNLKIICTFNTELKNIDDALLREGRLKGMHEFKKIQPKRAQKIAEVLGRDIEIDGPMTLAEICASEGNSMDYRPQKIGFENPFAQ